MTPDRFARVKAIFVRALELPASEREKLLSRECAGDTELRAEIESLLAHQTDETLAPGLEASGPARARLEPGNVFADRYRISILLGRGAMGEVYLARDRTLDVEVALKLLLSRAGDAGSRLLEEVRLARQVTHPCVCRVFDVGESNGEPFLTMEYVAGADLAATLRRVGRLSPEKVRDIGIQLCQGLAAAHAAGVLHRDLKPSNVILDGDGRVHITDFGIAVPTDAGGRARTAGTPAYMAPELLSGGAATEQSDLYAVGLILQEALTGRSPVPTDGTQAQTDAGGEPAEGSISPLTEIDEQLDIVICELTDPSPEKRPASATAVVERLQRARSVEPDARARRSKPWRAVLVVGGLAAASLAAAWLLGGSTVWRASEPEAPPAAPQDSRVGVAVLPFTGVGTSPEDQSLVDGIHAELITELSKIRDLRVISRASVIRIGAQSEDLAELGKRLGVSAIAEGRVRRAGDRVRVHVELADARTGEDLWSERYDRALAGDGVFQIESDVAREIASRVGARLSPEDQARLDTGEQSHDSARASDLYLSARGLEAAGTPEAISQALDVIQRALAEDPDSVRILVLSGLLQVRAARWRLLAPAAAYPAAREAARRALELDPEFAEAHAVLCEVLSEYDRDWNGAEAACRRAIELNPSYDRAFGIYARLLAARGRREESAAMMTRAWKLDPTSGQMQAAAADIWLHLGDYERAIATAKVAVALAPELAQPQATLGLAQIRTGDPSLGVRTVEQAAELAGREPIALAVLGYAYGLAKRTVEAKMILTQLGRLSGERRARPDELFLVQLGLGRNDDALESLAQAIAERSPLVMWMAQSRYFDPLRSDPRFAPLLRETGLGE